MKYDSNEHLITLKHLAKKSCVARKNLQVVFSRNAESVLCALSLSLSLSIAPSGSHHYPTGASVASTDVRLPIRRVLLVLYPKTTGTISTVNLKQNSRSEYTQMCKFMRKNLNFPHEKLH